MTQHLGKVGNPKEPQGDVFCAEMQVSWTRNDVWPEHERLELENDLIAAYVLSVGAVPAAQFSAGGGRE